MTIRLLPLLLLPTFALAGGLHQHAAPATAAAASVGPSSHAPIGVMGDHMHKAGEWMVSFRAMSMTMEGLQDGRDKLSSSQVTGSMMTPGRAMVAPTRMSMDMQMLGVMYAPSDSLTLMAMTSYASYEMDHVTRMGMSFTTETAGLGDTRLAGLFNVYHSENGAHRLHFTAGLSVPTGSIDEKDDTPAMADAKLPYAMQLGSGSYDLMPALTYQGYAGVLNWGAQVSAFLPLERNDNGYRLGNKGAFTVWVARKASDYVSTSLRLHGESQGRVDGERDDLNPMMVTSADPDNYGGEFASLSYGLNVFIPNGALENHRFALEYTVPLYQKMNGIQLQREPTVTAGWQLAF